MLLEGAPTADIRSLSDEQLVRLGRDALSQQRYRDALGFLSEYCWRMQREDKPVSASVLAGYGLALGHVADKKMGIKICLKALSGDRRNPQVFLCLARLYLLSDSRKSAVDAVLQGLRFNPDHRELLALRRGLGVRQATPIPFLPREAPVNVRLGRTIHRLKSRLLPASEVV